jgi:Papain fold toxin 2
MPDYPETVAAAQAIARAITRKYGNYECAECAKDLVLAIGPGIDASVVKLLNDEGEGSIILPAEGRHVSWSGHHVGVRIGQMIYDNQFPDGVAADEWAPRYADAEENPLISYHRPIGDFFGQRFRRREFSGFVSNRFQDEELET